MRGGGEPWVGRGSDERMEEAEDPAGVGEDGSGGGDGQSGLVARIGIPDYAAVMSSFKEVVNPSKILPPVSHKVVHHIETAGRPVAAR